MPKRQLTEEETYKADVRKKSSQQFKFLSEKEQESLVNHMWKREDEKRLKRFEETLGKSQGLKRREIKDEITPEEVSPGLWRDTIKGKGRVKMLGEKHKLKWI